ncbi:MAG: NBR1-Ig-like domain-containing protein [Chloroflexota bacterium]
MSKKLRVLPWLLMSLLVLAACNTEADPTPIIPEPTAEPEPATPTAVLSTDPVRGQATVDSIQVMLLESFPVQVNILARGELADGCTSLEEVVTQQTGNTFRVVMTTLHDPSLSCTTALVPFEENISLDVEGLTAGTYNVMVNGISGSFSLDVDNFVAEEIVEEEPTPEPTAVPEEEPVATISGRVWHDLCVGTGGQVAEGDETAVGCIAVATDAGQILQANGVLEANEEGIAGVEVALGVGECPAESSETTLTSESGEFSFTDLSGGTYCLSVDGTSAVNTAVLDEGVWSLLPNDATSTSIIVDEGETLADNNFGWDYSFLPEPEVDASNCTNDSSFVSDLTVPDDTIFAPGDEFEVGWRLRNTGTCPWTTDYSAVFVGGDNLSADTAPLTGNVAPGQTVDIFVTMTAPDAEGTYRSDWQMADADGNRIGIDGFLENVFWVQIGVGVPEEPTPTPEPGTASIGGVAWRDFCSNGNPGGTCVEVGEGSGIFRGNGTFDGFEQPLVGLTITLAQNECPSDTPINPNDIITTALTGDDGTYRFSNLETGVYCIFVDAFSPENVDLLIPGDFSWPAVGVNRSTFFLDPGEQEDRIDFGWDDFDD